MLPRYWIEHRKVNDKDGVSDLVRQFQSMVPPPIHELKAPQSFAVCEEDLAVLRQHLEGFDHLRYGMSFQELQSVVHDEVARAQFEGKYGITLDEYLQRVSSGENMGDTLVDGKFGPAGR